MSKSNTKYVDYLTEDTPIAGQLWVCISFLSPEGIKNCSVRGLKIRGVFGTKQEADLRANELQKIDSSFHVFVGEMGKWLPWDPDVNSVEDQIYQEKELNDLMKGYKDNLAKTTKMELERKESMIREGAKIEQAKNAARVAGNNVNTNTNTNTNTSGMSTKERLRNKLQAKKQNEKMTALANKNIKMTEEEEELKLREEELKERDQMIKNERNRLNGTSTEIQDTVEVIESIDDKMAKIQELYNKINKK